MYPGLFDLFARHGDCYFQLFTNGTLLTPDVAVRLRKVRNVTPMISIEGLEKESDARRGRSDVFRRTMEGVENCVRQKLIIGAAASICKSNFDELVSRKYIEYLAGRVCITSGTIFIGRSALILTPPMRFRKNKYCNFDGLSSISGAMPR